MTLIPKLSRGPQPAVVAAVGRRRRRVWLQTSLILPLDPRLESTVTLKVAVNLKPKNIPCLNLTLILTLIRVHPFEPSLESTRMLMDKIYP